MDATETVLMLKRKFIVVNAFIKIEFKNGLKAINEPVTLRKWKGKVN